MKQAEVECPRCKKKFIVRQAEPEDTDIADGFAAKFDDVIDGISDALDSATDALDRGFKKLFGK